LQLKKFLRLEYRTQPLSSLKLELRIRPNVKLNNIVTLKSGLEVPQGNSSWYHSKDWVRFPICLL